MSVDTRSIFSTGIQYWTVSVHWKQAIYGSTLLCCWRNTSTSEVSYKMIKIYMLNKFYMFVLNNWIYKYINVHVVLLSSREGWGWNHYMISSWCDHHIILWHPVPCRAGFVYVDLKHKKIKSSQMQQLKHIFLTMIMAANNVCHTCYGMTP